MELGEQDWEVVKLITKNELTELSKELKKCIKDGISEAVLQHQNNCPHKAEIARGKAFFAGMMVSASFVGGVMVLLVKKIIG